MPKSVNKVILLGNVGKDPEVKFLPSGLPVANLTLATSDRFKDKAGEWQDRTEWHNLTAYQRVAEIIRDYVKKGAKLYIEGQLQTRKWTDKEGQERYTTEIVLGRFNGQLTMLDGRSGGSEGFGGGPDDEMAPAPRASSGDGMSRGGGGGGRAPATQDLDDEIPF